MENIVCHIGSLFFTYQAGKPLCLKNIFPDEKLMFYKKLNSSGEHKNDLMQLVFNTIY